MHTIVAMIELGRADDAAAMATTELELSQHLIDTMTEAVHEPALVALLLGKSAQASERGIAFTLTEDSQLDDAETAVLTPRDLVTVVGNLVDNALDAAADDPWVEVSVSGGSSGSGSWSPTADPVWIRTRSRRRGSRDSPPSRAVTTWAADWDWHWWHRLSRHTAVN